MTNYNYTAEEAGRLILDKYLSSKHKKVIISNLIISSSELLLREPVHIEWIDDVHIKGIEKTDNFLSEIGIDQIQDKGYWPLPALNIDATGIVHMQNMNGIMLVDACVIPQKKFGTVGPGAFNMPEQERFFEAAQKYFGCKTTDWTNSELGLRFAYLYLFNEVLKVPAWYTVVNFISSTKKSPMNVMGWNEYFYNIFQDLGLDKDCKLGDKLIMVYPPLQV